MAKAVFDPNEEFDDLEDPFSDLDDHLGGSTDSSGSDDREPVRSLEEFDAEVDKNIKLLMSKKLDAKERQRIAYWLGNSGAPKAITALAVIYKKDKKNHAVQKAAAYALGQFKALDQAIERAPGEPVAEALQRSENAWIVELLTDIALYDETGKRLRIPVRTLVIFMFVLVLTLGGMLAAYFTLPTAERAETPEVAAVVGLSAPDSLDYVRDHTPDARTIAETLKARFDALAAGGTLDCAEINISPPPPLQTDLTTYPTLRGLVAQYNSAVENIDQAWDTFEAACRAAATTPDPAATPQTLAAADRDAAVASLTAALDSLTQIENGLTSAQEEIDTAATATSDAAASATAEAAAVPAVTETLVEPPTEIPPPTETLGITRQQLNTQVAALYQLIDGATGARGHTALLDQYWRDAQEFQRADGCSAVRPDVPFDYVLPPDVEPFAPQALKDAVTQVNSALALSRTGWDFFRSACATGTILTQTETGLSTTSTAITLYDAASQVLGTIR